MDPIKVLLLKYLRGESGLTLVERARLDGWLSASEANRELLAELTDPDRVAAALDKMERLNESRVWEKVQASLHDPPMPVSRIGFFRRKGWVAAAVLILALGGAVVVSLMKGRNDTASPGNDGRLVQQTDIVPGGNKAILTLSGGQQIVLDSMADGKVAKQGGATVTKLANGQLAYVIDKQGGNEVLYNTMSTPRGGQYKLVLPDGTAVWLNAASSITYPTVFAGGQRVVSVTGEAYFEVASDKVRPFQVKVNEMEVVVLGTHFNINSYQDEAAIRTTLLEGSIKVLSHIPGRDPQAVVLKPGQQAQAATQIKVIDHADVGQVMAWKNGLFNFDKLPLQEVLRQLSRWYDVEVVYEGTIAPKKFGGEIGRDLNLSEVLDGLKETGVHFNVVGRKLIVMP